MRQHGSEQSALVTLTFDLLTLKVVSESRVTSATSMPILVFLGLRQKHLLMPRLLGAGYNNGVCGTDIGLYRKSSFTVIAA